MAIFFRLLADEDKGFALMAALQALQDGTADASIFEVDRAAFESVPRAPFAYWAGAHTLSVFASFPRLQSFGRVGVSGGKTLDDFRFIRTAWEIPQIPDRGWFSFAKGGAFSPYYADVYLTVDWRDDARALKTYLIDYRGTRGWSPNWTAELHGSEYYLRPGLTWSRRTQKGLTLRALPRGCIFADKGPAAFVENDVRDELLTLLAVANSSPFRAFVKLQMAFGSYEVGVIQRTPVPELRDTHKERLTTLAHRAWSVKRGLDTATQNSHAFILPALVQVDGACLAARAAMWLERVREAEGQFTHIQAEIDDLAFELYGIGDADRAVMETGDRVLFADGLVEEAAEADDAESAGQESEAEVGADTEALTASLVSWAVGVAFGRFDVRLATGERVSPPEPDPFDPLPSCSPGMLTGEHGLPLEAPPLGYPLAFPLDGIFADDQGDRADITGQARAAFDCVFGLEADRIWIEAAQILGNGDSDLRQWLRRNLFEDTIRRYSKSRRKAPIYWQLATTSSGYSVWLYYHRLRRDTLYKVLNDHVRPKLLHEERRLAVLNAEGGANPNASQRKQIAEQDGFLEELRAFHDEIARVAPLWNPDLNDGVIINFAPLWQLVPQHRAWQRECKACWGKLVAGDYDWAHLAMHLWPERVVPKCAEDRSLAIAHDLEGVFWTEGNDGRWKQRDVATRLIEELVRERTSPAVKAALKNLLEAPAPDGDGVGRARGAPRRRRRTTNAGATTGPPL